MFKTSTGSQGLSWFCGMFVQKNISCPPIPLVDISSGFSDTILGPGWS